MGLNSNPSPTDPYSAFRPRVPIFSPSIVFPEPPPDIPGFLSQDVPYPNEQPALLQPPPADKAQTGFPSYDPVTQAESRYQNLLARRAQALQQYHPSLWRRILGTGVAGLTGAAAFDPYGRSEPQVAERGMQAGRSLIYGPLMREENVLSAQIPAAQEDVKMAQELYNRQMQGALLPSYLAQQKARTTAEQARASWYATRSPQQVLAEAEVGVQNARASGDPEKIRAAEQNYQDALGGVKQSMRPEREPAPTEASLAARAEQLGPDGKPTPDALAAQRALDRLQQLRQRERPSRAPTALELWMNPKNRPQLINYFKASHPGYSVQAILRAEQIADKELGVDEQYLGEEDPAKAAAMREQRINEILGRTGTQSPEPSPTSGVTLPPPPGTTYPPAAVAATAAVSGAPGAKAKKAENRIRVVDPQGKFWTIPESQLKQAEGQGYKEAPRQGQQPVTLPPPPTR